MPTTITVLGTPDIHSPEPHLLGPRLSRLLGLLAASERRPVRTAVLVERLWPERTPPSGESALRVQMTRLRRHLGSAGAIVATPGRGYQLADDPAQLVLDSDEFQVAVFSADAAVRAGEYRAAGDQYRHGLKLWRGDAYDSCDDDPDVMAVKAGLEALRRRARRSLVDVSLRNAESDRVDLAELHQLAAQQPGDEELASVFIEGLVRLGQPAEALEVHRRTEAHLRDVLGVGPSKQFRAIVSQLASTPVTGAHV